MGLTRAAPEDSGPYVKKQRTGGPVGNLTTDAVYATLEGGASPLSTSKASSTVNTSFVVRQHGTGRHLNRRKTRKTLAPSKENFDPLEAPFRYN